MSKKVVEVLVAEIANIDANIYKMLIERADLKVGAELFEPDIIIDEARLIRGPGSKTHKTKKVSVETIIKGKNANKIVRRARKKTARLAIAGSILFSERIENTDSARLVQKSFLQHLVSTGYIKPAGNFYLTIDAGKKYMRTYANTGIKFYTDTFDELIKECGFKFTRKKELA